MPSSYISDYIESQLLKGIQKEQIIDSLLENKWKKEDIEIAFLELDKKLEKANNIEEKASDTSYIKPSLESRVDNEQKNNIKKRYEASHKTMSGPLNIIADAFYLYKERFTILIIVSLIIQIILGVTGYFFETSFYKSFLLDQKENQTYISMVSNGLIALIYLWLSGVVIASIAKNTHDEEVGIIESFIIGKAKLFSLLWLTLLFIFINISISAIIVSALIVTSFFFAKWANIFYVISVTLEICLIIISVIWYILSVLILFDENKLGIGALIKAREAARGRWIGIIYRFIFSSIFFIAIFVVLFCIVIFIPEDIDVEIKEMNLGTIIIRTVMVFFVPLIASYFFFLYQNLTETKSEVNLEGSTKYIKYLAMFCSFGVIIIISTIILTNSSGAINNNLSINFNKTKEQIFYRIINNYKFFSG